MMDYVDVLEEEIVEGMKIMNIPMMTMVTLTKMRKKIMITVKWIIVVLTMR